MEHNATMHHNQRILFKSNERKYGDVGKTHLNKCISGKLCKISSFHNSFFMCYMKHVCKLQRIIRKNCERSEMYFSIVFCFTLKPVLLKAINVYFKNWRTTKEIYAACLTYWALIKMLFMTRLSGIKCIGF